MEMTKKEFVHQCLAMGYANTIQAKYYCQDNPKARYTEDDMLAVQRLYAWVDDDFLTPVGSKRKDSVTWQYDGYRSDDFHVVFG